MNMLTSIKNLMGADPIENADADMREVLTAFQNLHPEHLETLDPIVARRQPTVTDAVHEVMRQKGITVDLTRVRTQDIQIPAAMGTNPGRVYTPTNVPEGQALPVILYFHGGGFVIADLDTYDATPRAIAEKARAIVVSAHYRQAPEHRFPAAHEDANATWTWLVKNAASFGGDPSRIAILGESAGGNLAANVAIHARDTKQQMPVFLGLVYPMADTNTMSLSYEENRHARPLDKPMMLWFVKQCLANPDDKKDQRLKLVEQDFIDLPPTSVVIAGIDPLRSDGENLVDKMRGDGVEVDLRYYNGATHEFFGMASVVQAARDAQAFIVQGLDQAFGGPTIHRPPLESQTVFNTSSVPMSTELPSAASLS